MCCVWRTRKWHLLLSCSKLSGSAGFQCRARSSGGVNISVHTTAMRKFKFVGFNCVFCCYLPLCCAVNPKSAWVFYFENLPNALYHFFHCICRPGSTWFDSVWLEGVYQTNDVLVSIPVVLSKNHH